MNLGTLEPIKVANDKYIDRAIKIAPAASENPTDGKERYMSKVIYKGLKENGLIDAELKRTPVLITELIEKVTKEKTSKMDIVHELEEIRKSAEIDQRIAQTYVSVLKANNSVIKPIKDEDKDV